LSRVADGVVVGSAIVSRIEELAADPRAMHSEVAALVSSMRRAIDGGAA
jgi:tryptophan synthase alpha chain